MKVTYRWTGAELAKAARITPREGSRLRLVSLNDVKFEGDIFLGPNDSLFIEIESSSDQITQNAQQGPVEPAEPS